jgi:hypothetical protein
MTKKQTLTLVLIILACVAAYFIYNSYNKVALAPVVESQNTTEFQPATSTRPVVTPERQAIIDAMVLKMTTVMTSKNVKKIREFSQGLYSTKEEKDAVGKLTDAQVLQSAQLYMDFNMSESISLALASLPDSAWNISSTTASVTQSADGEHKATFTVTKVNGIWQ